MSKPQPRPPSRWVAQKLETIGSPKNNPEGGSHKNGLKTKTERNKNGQGGEEFEFTSVGGVMVQRRGGTPKGNGTNVEEEKMTCAGGKTEMKRSE